MLNRWCVFLALATPVLGNSAGAAQDDATELAKQLANPIASLISVPLQFNYDEKYGLSDEGVKFLINVQPVIPISLSEDWNVISRTILPLVHLSDVPPGNDESGLGDTTQSLFFSPSQPTSRRDTCLPCCGMPHCGRRGIPAIVAALPEKCSCGHE